MIIIKDLKIKNYRNARNITLKSLSDINLIIGPNNCGKTSILEAISGLANIRVPYYTLASRKDVNIFEKVHKERSNIASFSYPLRTEDRYLHKEKVEIEISLNRQIIDSEVPGVTEKIERIFESKNITFEEKITLLEAEKGTELLCEHLTIFSDQAILEWIKNNVLCCPESRLQGYKGKDFVGFIRDKQLSLTQKRKWVDFLGRVIDPKIDDEKYERLIRKEGGEDFETTIEEQGSGVRSLICLAADILFTNKKIMLIDEPELGLNPSVKQAFLRFLMQQAKEKQVFIATHDPCFVNPIILLPNEVSIYTYTPVDEAHFVKIDLNQSRKEPYTFGGYLPHPESLKPIHIYVEGIKDVHRIQKILFEKFDDKIDILNKIGVYHLAGSFWKHLLHTIPSPPHYKAIIILDPDKEKEAEDVCKVYNSVEIVCPRFKFCKDIQEIKESFRDSSIPVYCLKQKDVEQIKIEKEERLDEIFDILME